MSENKEIVQKLRIKEIHKDAYRETISKTIKDKFGYELPLKDGKTAAYSYEKLIDIVNVFFKALVQAVEDNYSE
jgi:hypothetical protein